MEYENSWDRQPTESTVAYEAFCYYRDSPHVTPPKKRTLQSTADALNKSLSTIKQWSNKWSWQERCRDYDNKLQRAKLKAMEEAHIAIADVLQKTAMNALESLQLEKMSPRNILDFLVQSLEIERRAKIEQAGAIMSTKSNKNGKTSFLEATEEQEESPMMQLIKSLESARNEKKE